MVNERRRVPRYFADVRAALFCYDSGMSAEVLVEILSVQGCCIRGEGIPEAGRRCRLTLRWKNSQIVTEAQVVWKDAQGLAGLRFTSTDQDSVDNLRALCANLRLQPLTPWTAIENP